MTYPEPAGVVNQVLDSGSSGLGLPPQGGVAAVRRSGLAVAAGHIMQERDGVPHSPMSPWCLHNSQQRALVPFPARFKFAVACVFPGIGGMLHE